ncbi:unnamed protein product, partial [Ceratitis capitata]
LVTAFRTPPVDTFVEEIVGFEVPCAAPSAVITPTASSSTSRGAASPPFTCLLLCRIKNFKWNSDLV